MVARNTREQVRVQTPAATPLLITEGAWSLPTPCGRGCCCPWRVPISPRKWIWIRPP